MHLTVPEASAPHPEGIFSFLTLASSICNDETNHYQYFNQRLAVMNESDQRQPPQIQVTALDKSNWQQQVAAMRDSHWKLQAIAAIDQRQQRQLQPEVEVQ